MGECQCKPWWIITRKLADARRYEAWRLRKLRDLKQKYDPNNRFRFFAPILPGNA
jgi:hypothetical protein